MLRMPLYYTGLVKVARVSQVQNGIISFCIHSYMKKIRPGGNGRASSSKEITVLTFQSTWPQSLWPILLSCKVGLVSGNICILPLNMSWAVQNFVGKLDLCQILLRLTFGVHCCLSGTTWTCAFAWRLLILNTIEKCHVSIRITTIEQGKKLTEYTSLVLCFGDLAWTCGHLPWGHVWRYFTVKLRTRK